MMAGSISERRKERRELLTRIEAQRERSWSAERRRLAELHRTLAFHETAHP
jgi:hypothetical protein